MIKIELAQFPLIINVLNKVFFAKKVLNIALFVHLNIHIMLFFRLRALIIQNKYQQLTIYHYQCAYEFLQNLIIIYPMMISYQNSKFDCFYIIHIFYKAIILHYKILKNMLNCQMKDFIILIRIILV